MRKTSIQFSSAGMQSQEAQTGLWQRIRSHKPDRFLPSWTGKGHGGNCPREVHMEGWVSGQQEFAKGKTRREQLEGESEGMKQNNLCEQHREWWVFTLAWLPGALGRGVMTELLTRTDRALCDPRPTGRGFSPHLHVKRGTQSIL